MKTKLEAALLLLNMAQAETDAEKREALLVGIHHTLRCKLHQDRNRFARVMRKHLAAYAGAADAIAKGGVALEVESGTSVRSPAGKPPAPPES